MPIKFIRPTSRIWRHLTAAKLTKQIRENLKGGGSQPPLLPNRIMLRNNQLVDRSADLILWRGRWR